MANWRHLLVLALVASALAGCAAQPTSTLDAARVELEVRDTEARYKQAAAQGDYEAMAGFVTPDFVYIDISGNRMTPESMLARRGADHRVVVREEVLAKEVVALSPTTAVVRSHAADLSHYFGGLPRRAESRTTVVWTRGDDSQWRMASAQANIVMRPVFPVKIRTAMTDERLAAFAGAFILDTAGGLPFVLTAGEGALHARIPGHLDDMAFYPEADAAFFATDRPFELRFDGPNEATLVTWGEATRAVRNP